MSAPVTTPRNGNFIPQSVKNSYVHWTIFNIICQVANYRFGSPTDYFLPIDCTWSRNGYFEVQAVTEEIEDRFPAVDLDADLGNTPQDRSETTTEDFITLVTAKIEEVYGKELKVVIDTIVEKTDWNRFTADNLPMDADITLELGNDSLDVVEMIAKIEEELNIDLPEDFYPTTVMDLIDATIKSIE